MQSKCFSESFTMKECIIKFFELNVLLRMYNLEEADKIGIHLKYSCKLKKSYVKNFIQEKISF